MVFLLNPGNQIIAYLWVSCYIKSISSSRRADMFAVSSESSFAFSFNIICCSIFQSCRLLCFAVLECNVKPSLIYSGIKCCLCIAKLQHPLKLTLVKDCWLEKSISTSRTTAIHSASWEKSSTLHSSLLLIAFELQGAIDKDSYELPQHALLNPLRCFKMNQQQIFADCMLMRY